MQNGEKMAAFSLTAQLQLQAPSNTQQVARQIRQQLSGITVPVNIQANSRAASQAASQVAAIGNAAQTSGRQVRDFGARLAGSFRQLTIFTAVTGSILKLSNAIKTSTSEAIAFEKELIKISQITGQSVSQLGGLVGTINTLSTSLGVSSGELLTAAKTLTQAGFAAQTVEKSLKVLAQSTLGSSFDSLSQTVEGSIAVLNQFSKAAREAGGEAIFLQQTLDAINAVSKNFAVESADLITAVRRVGGVFSSAGGSVEELIALFTSVRSTTREGAETIATGLRTIFTRIQRVETINLLRQLGIELSDAEGRFVGAYEAFRLLSNGLAGLDPRDFRFGQIIEQLGGFRQIGKVIPLVQQFAVSQEALNIAQNSSGSIAADALKAQDSLANQFAKTREQFDKLIRTFTNSESFQTIIRFALKMAQSFISVLEALEPLLPLLTTLGAIKIGAALGPAIGRGVGLSRNNAGGKIHKFARGGYVPGTGNRDTVPAMLQPGEFVIKQSSARNLGPSTLNAMNSNRFEDGGLQQRLASRGGVELSRTALAPINTSAVLRIAGDKDPADKELDIGAAFLRPDAVIPRVQAQLQSTGEIYSDVTRGLNVGTGTTVSQAEVRRIVGDVGNRLSIVINSGSLEANQSEAFGDSLRADMSNFATNYAQSYISKGSGPQFNKGKFTSAYNGINTEQIEGGVFEAMLNGLAGAPYDERKIAPNDNLDFKGGLGAAGSLFNIPGTMPADAKRTFNQDALTSLTKKGRNLLVEGLRTTLALELQRRNFAPGNKAVQENINSSLAGSPFRTRGRLQGRNSGGGIGGGSDTVPALLTPGEFVINRKSARSIGYSNLASMNRTGVSRFATGGAVGALGIQRFAGGGVPVSLTGSPEFAKFARGLESASTNMLLFGVVISTAISSLGIFGEENNRAATVAVTTGLAYASLLTTLASMLTSNVANTAAENADTAATTAHTGAVVANAKALGVNTVSLSKSSAGASKMLTSGFSALVGTTVILTSTFAYYNQKLREETERLEKERDERVENTRETGEGGELIRSSNLDIQESRARSSASNTAAVVGTIVGTIVGLGTAIGTAAATAWSGPGAAAAGIGAGTAAGFGTYAAVFETLNSQYQQEIDQRIALVNALNASFAELIVSQGKINQAYKEAEQIIKNLPSNATEQQRDAAETQAREVRNQAIGDAVDPERLRRQTDLDRRVIQNVNAREEQADAGWLPNFIDGISDFEEATRNQAKANLEERNERLKEISAQASQNLGASATAVFDGSVTFDEIIADPANEFTIALNNMKDVIAAQTEVQIANLRIAISEAQTVEERRRLTQEMLDVREREKEQIQDLEDGYKGMAEAAIENQKAAVASAQALEQWRQRLAVINAFEGAIQDATQALDGLSISGGNIDSILSGGVQSGATVTPRGLENLNQVGNRDQFNADTRAIGSRFGEFGEILAERAIRASEIGQNARDGLLGRDFTGLQDTINVGQELTALGVDFEGLTDQQRSQVTEAFTAAIKDGIIDEGELEKIFAPIFAEGEAAAKALASANELLNGYLQQYQATLEALNEQFQKEIQARQGVVDAQAKAQELVARAEGRELTFAENERNRAARAQAPFSSRGFQATGFNVDGQDVGSLQGARTAALQESSDIQRRLQDNTLPNEERQRLLARSRELALVMDTTSEAMNNLADQSDKAADIMSEIEKQRKTLDTIGKIAEDFVVGSNEERFGMNQTFAATQNAIATGSLQQFPPELRRDVLGLLDQLGDDIEVAPGVSASQARRNLVAADAQRLGLPPAVAQALAQNSTPVERQLQNQMRVLGQQMIEAAQANAQFEEQRTNLLIDQEKQLVNAINTLTQTLQAAADAEQARQDQQRAQQDADAMAAAFGPPAGQDAPAFANGGGPISGAGGPTSDSILARVSNGEYILNADATRKLGPEALASLNRGELPMFANGGSVGEQRRMAYRERKYQEEAARRDSLDAAREAYEARQAEKREAYQEEMENRRNFYATPEGRIARARGGVAGFQAQVAAENPDSGFAGYNNRNAAAANNNGFAAGNGGFNGGGAAPQAQNAMGMQGMDALVMTAQQLITGLQNLGNTQITINVNVSGNVNVTGFNASQFSDEMRMLASQEAKAALQNMGESSNTDFTAGP